jgi:hypothetical protein
MPSPQAIQIESALKQALLAKGFVKRSYDSNGAITVDPTSLPDALQKLVEGFAGGDNVWFSQWQATQTVLVPGVTSGPSTAVGTLP